MKKSPTITSQTSKQPSTKKTNFDTQTEMTTSTQQAQTFTSSGGGSNSNSHSTDDEKVGPQHFIPIKMLGSGSFGEVYLVKEKKTSKLYAMKVLSKHKIMG